MKVFDSFSARHPYYHELFAQHSGSEATNALSLELGKLSRRIAALKSDLEPLQARRDIEVARQADITGGVPLFSSLLRDE